MIRCEHCGASVHGNVCEYCDMPVNRPAPTKIIYKPDTPKKIVIPPVIKHKKKFFCTILLGGVSVFAVSVMIMGIAISHNVTRTYIQSPPEYAIEHNYDYDYDYCYDYDYDYEFEDDFCHDDSYRLEEALPVYDANEILQENGAFPSGTYQIGVDIPEGLYIFLPDMADGHGIQGVYADPDCQNQISSAYVHFDGSRIAEISGRGYLDFAWATAYNLDMHPEIVNDPYETDGMFIVGRDIPAGTYALTGYGEYEDDAEWYIYSSINAVGTIIKESGRLNTYGDYMENITNEITLNDGEFLELRHCIIDY